MLPEEMVQSCEVVYYQLGAVAHNSFEISDNINKSAMSLCSPGLKSCSAGSSGYTTTVNVWYASLS